MGPKMEREKGGKVMHEQEKEKVGGRGGGFCFCGGFCLFWFERDAPHHVEYEPPRAALPPRLSLPCEGHGGNDWSTHALSPLQLLRLHLSGHPLKAPCKLHPAAAAAAAAAAAYI